MIAQIRTKNHSARPLKGKIYSPFRAVVRLGSRTPTENIFPNGCRNNKRIIEINTRESIENSRDKLLMKACFAEAGIPQAKWYGISNDNGDKYLTDLETNTIINRNELPYPILMKRINGFGGHGMIKLDTPEELDNWLNNNNTVGYYAEHMRQFAREYRLHCTQTKCFMAWRKLRRSDTPEDRRWFFNSENCNWVGEDHELFDRPSNWDNIVSDCLRAIRAVGLEIGSFDVRIQSSRNSNPEYVLIEVNSAPSLAEQGIQAYKKIIQELIYSKC